MLECRSEFKSKLTYKMPDKSEIQIGTERMLCSECLFEPEFFGHDLNSVQATMGNSLKGSN